jgi:hypothetical protein
MAPGEPAETNTLLMDYVDYVDYVSIIVVRVLMSKVIFPTRFSKK